MEGIKLEFTPEALQEIVDQARVYDTGARALRSIIENHMLDIMFNLPNLTNVERCIINRDVVAEGWPPEYVDRRKKRAQ